MAVAGESLMITGKAVGALEVIRTPDIRLRRPTLYPAELRAQCLVDSPQTSNTKGLYKLIIANALSSARAIISIFR